MPCINKWSQEHDESNEEKILQTMIKGKSLHTKVVESKHKQMMKAQKPHTKVVKITPKKIMAKSYFLKNYKY